MMFWIVPLLLAASAPVSTAALPAKLEAMSRAGNAEAAYHLGMLYHLGIQRPKDTARAFKLFVQASEAGDALGAFKVGCYYAGQGGDAVPADAAKALHYSLIAAEGGYDLAQVEVALRYIAEQRNADALPWLLRAAAQGNTQGYAELVRISFVPGSSTRDLGRAYEYLRLLQLKIQADGGAIGNDGAAILYAKLTPQQQIEADQHVTAFKAKPTPISLRARAGLDAARQLVGERRAQR